LETFYELFSAQVVVVVSLQGAASCAVAIFTP